MTPAIGVPVRLLCGVMAVASLVAAALTPRYARDPWAAAAVLAAFGVVFLIPTLFAAGEPDAGAAAAASLWYPRIRRAQAILAGVS